ncbi:hypothetical protein BP6252_08570 [Coleophoma cylindrospora]|uniref:Uncharacterized protein n=1 Tax=Coleophoma cylindrospora TaxID=1849047 RepID=A0A3D8R6H3_9HELO|nr:hypothetical protein BP6252_08570 [Coleophoma cylindrospora]
MDCLYTSALLSTREGRLWFFHLHLDNTKSPAADLNLPDHKESSRDSRQKSFSRLASRRSTTWEGQKIRISTTPDQSRILNARKCTPQFQPPSRPDLLSISRFDIVVHQARRTATSCIGIATNGPEDALEVRSRISSRYMIVLDMTLKDHPTAGPSAGSGLTRDMAYPRKTTTFTINEEHFVTNLSHVKDDAVASLTIHTPEHLRALLTVHVTAKRNLAAADNREHIPFHVVHVEIPASLLSPDDQIDGKSLHPPLTTESEATYLIDLRGIAYMATLDLANVTVSIPQVGDVLYVTLKNRIDDITDAEYIPGTEDTATEDAAAGDANDATTKAAVNENPSNVWRAEVVDPFPFAHAITKKVDSTNLFQATPAVTVNVAMEHSNQNFKDDIRTMSALFASTAPETIRFREHLLFQNVEESPLLWVNINDLHGSSGIATTARAVYNQSQVDIVNSFKNAPKVIPVWGPFGTGKSTISVTESVVAMSDPSVRHQVAYSVDTNLGVDDICLRMDFLCNNLGLKKKIIIFTR